MLSRFLRAFYCHSGFVFCVCVFFFFFFFYIFRRHLIEMLLHGNKNIFLTKCSHSISCCIFLFHMVLKLTVSVGNAIDKASEK